jgi:DNA polymerase-3 subunit epsilon
VNFVAIDVETANPNMASICQVGLVQYVAGAPVDEWMSYVDPQDDFDDINVSIHGIDEVRVRGAPTFPQISGDLFHYLRNSLVVCYTHFDRLALAQTSQRYKISVPRLVWLDSARVARRAWEDCAWKGYGLAKICKKLGYEFQHHDALEDAKAAAFVLTCAIRDTGLSTEEWLKRIEQPIILGSGSSGSDIKRAGNPNGHFFGDVLVFTGSLTIPRRDAADMAAGAGFQVAPSVTKATTILVVGDQDTAKLAGHTKSTKHRKAEELISAGVAIRIVRESDFKELVKLSSPVA